MKKRLTALYEHIVTACTACHDFPGHIPAVMLIADCQHRGLQAVICPFLEVFFAPFFSPSSSSSFGSAC